LQKGGIKTEGRAQDDVNWGPRREGMTALGATGNGDVVHQDGTGTGKKLQKPKPD